MTHTCLKSLFLPLSEYTTIGWGEVTACKSYERKTAKMAPKPGFAQRCHMMNGSERYGYRLFKLWFRLFGEWGNHDAPQKDSHSAQKGTRGAGSARGTWGTRGSTSNPASQLPQLLDCKHTPTPVNLLTTLPTPNDHHQP